MKPLRSYFVHSLFKCNFGQNWWARPPFLFVCPPFFFVHGLYTVLYGTIYTGTNMMTVPRLFKPSLPQDKVE